MKTHKGVRVELHRLMKEDPDFRPGLRSFLAGDYALKTVVNYDVGPEAEVTPEAARTALEQAKRFVGFFQTRLMKASD